MYLEDVMPAFRRGEKIRRKCWNLSIYIQKGNDYSAHISHAPLGADDWEVVETLHTFNEMMEHLEKGGKARRKGWEKDYPDGYWYADGDYIRESLANQNCFLDLSTIKLNDWILF